MIVSSATAGAEVKAYMPGSNSPMPRFMSTTPLSPKYLQGLPVLASSANSRVSMVVMMIRVAQCPSASAEGAL